MGDSVFVYTDGSIEKNPGGVGGWAAIILNGKKEKILTGYEDESTNNRMEIMGLIESLKVIPKNKKVIIRSDSQYVVNSANTWHKTWVRKRKNKANMDLWVAYNRLITGRDVKCEWVKGHNGDKYNEKADSYAVKARFDREDYIYKHRPFVCDYVI